MNLANNSELNANIRGLSVIILKQQGHPSGLGEYFNFVIVVDTFTICMQLSMKISLIIVTFGFYLQYLSSWIRICIPKPDPITGGK
jgi:hypothetical protein